MEQLGWARIEESPGTPRVHFPRAYNASLDLVDRHVALGRGARIAYRDDRGATTYAELAERVARAGSALRDLGVLPEQRVLMVMLDTVDFPAVFLGAMRIGAVPVPVNTLLTPEDYAYLLEDSRATVLVVSDHLLPKLEPAIARATRLRHVVVAETPLGGDTGGRPVLGEVLATASPACEPARTTPDDVAFWLYSSGSTGRPKGAMHLHAHLVQTAVLYGRGILGISPEDVCFSAAKLFFAYGLGNALTFPLWTGATAVLRAERPTASMAMRTIAEEKATIFFGVPTLFNSILSDAAVADATMPAVRFSVSAGEALPKAVGERWFARFGTHILDGIGSTEMLHVFVSNRPGDVRYGTTGRPVPGYQTKLVADDGDLAPDGEEGALWVSGPSAAIGYWNQRDKSIATFHGPWTRTGDRYVRSPEGHYVYVGRADDMLKVGGIWVSPLEVEDALAKHPDVREVGVNGRADVDGLVKPAAYVVLHDPSRASPELEAELKRFVKERLAPFKYPRWVTFLPELPRTATGKLQRYRLGG